jgi:hypothetical protein
MDDVNAITSKSRTHFTHFEVPGLPWKKCACGEDGSFKVGKKWYCAECYYNGDDEDDE